MNYLYHNICLRITIADKVIFTRCSSIKIDSDVEILGDYASIELPRQFKNALDIVEKKVDLSGRSILNFMNRGDAIKIELGYDDDLQTEFEGYITRIGAETPLVLECEDEMFQLKQAPRITKFVKTGKLIDILREIIPSKYKIVCNTKYSIGSWLIKKQTPYGVLNELREKIGIRAFFINPNTLYVGSNVDYKPEKIHKFNFSENIRRGCDLTFEDKENNPKKVIITSKQKNGKVIYYSTGVEGGDTIEIDMPGLTLEDIVFMAHETLKRKHYTGFRGSFDSWCYPRTKAGESAQLYRPMYKDGHQDGLYFIESVNISVNGSDGIKRTNRITYKLS